MEWAEDTAKPAITPPEAARQERGDAGGFGPLSVRVAPVSSGDVGR